MNENTSYLLSEVGIEIYKSGGNKAYMLCVINKNGGIGNYGIDYEIAEKLDINNIYLGYSVNLDIAIKTQFVKPYKIVDKIIDEKHNIILIVEELKNIDLENED